MNATTTTATETSHADFSTISGFFDTQAISSFFDSLEG
jgi:hypothetical protein